MNISTLAAAMLLAAPVQASEPTGIADWMVMEVCTRPDGTVMQGVAPTDAGCMARRKIRAQEDAPYALRSWAGGSACGQITKLNVPVEQSGVTRIVSTASRGAACPDADEAHNSVQWHDDHWGFIMGSWSPVAVSRMMGRDCSAAGSARYFDGWVIAPALVDGTTGYAAAASRIVHAPQGAACIEPRHRGFTWWTVAAVTFRGMTLPAIVSNHYAQAARDGVGPGGAMQMERTYWTQEFGLTRWEKWAREDWVNPRSHVAAPRLAEALQRTGVCSAPWVTPLPVSPGLAIQTGSTPWQHVALDPATGEAKAWVVTLCADYTDLKRAPEPNRATAAPADLWAPS